MTTRRISPLPPPFQTSSALLNSPFAQPTPVGLLSWDPLIPYIPNNSSSMSIPFVSLTHLPSSYSTISYTDVTTFVFCCCRCPLVCDASQLSSQNLPIFWCHRTNPSKLIWQFWSDFLNLFCGGQVEKNVNSCNMYFYINNICAYLPLIQT